jgi:Cu+-exporting ATPase
MIFFNVFYRIPGLDNFFKNKPNISLGRKERNSPMMKDPICGMMVDEKNRKKLITSEHEGNTFYFCSISCKQKFDSDPHKYGHPN